jgi:DNA-binding Xre family transcriptional regulator
MGILDDTNVKLLIEVMDLQKPTPTSLEITKYEFVKGTGIVINQIKVLDENGKYIKFAELEKVSDYLNKFPVKFK